MIVFISYLNQKYFALHLRHAGQSGPPQSNPVSNPFCMLSVQVAKGKNNIFTNY